MTNQGKRRPRWGRIFGVLGGFMLCIAAVIALVRLVTAPPVEEIVAPDNGTGGGLQFSPTSASGWVLSFTDPGVSLDGLRPATMDFGANYPANDTCAYCPLTLDKPYSSRRALARFDNTTRTLDWLCDIPGCNHTDPNCKSCLPTGFYDIFLDDDYLYLCIKDWQDGSCAIQRCDLDGGNRSEILCIKTDSVPYTLCNDQAIILADTAAGKIYAYEKATGALRQYMTVQPGIVPNFSGHFFTGRATDAGGVTHYIAVDIATGQERVMFDWTMYDPPGDSSGRRFASPAEEGGFYYYLRQRDAEKCQLVRQSISGGEEVVLNDDVFLPQDYTVGRLDAGNISEGCYVYSIAPMTSEQLSEDFTRYSFNIATGAPAAVPAVYDAMCFPVATFGNFYLANTMTPSASGIGMDVNSREFCMISREDYEAGRENYIPIQDNTR